MINIVWTIERLIKAGLVKVKEDPTVNGIHFHDTVWVPNACTLNVFEMDTMSSFTTSIKILMAK